MSWEEMPLQFDALAVALAASAEFEREGLRLAASIMLKAAEIIPLDARTLALSEAISAEYGLSGQDCIVLAAVLSHLESSTPVESCFLNRNSKDFDDSKIRTRLEARKCKFFARFDSGLNISRAASRKQTSGLS